MPTNSQVTQGTLNRLLTSVVIANLPTLNVTSPYMGSSFAQLQLDQNFSELIGTATGAVQSPQPYVMGTITVNLLKTQGLSAQWLAQAQASADLGQVTAYPDSTAFPPVTLDDCVIDTIAPQAYDGKDPVVRVTIRGVYYLNANMWSAI
ncbi:MAG: hypothetical protein ACRET1_09330 [Burkholderiales bacterium]